jgi:hypothetical protein
VFGAFASGIDERVAGAHRIVHENAVPDIESGLSCEADIRRHASADDNHIRLEYSVAVKPHGSNFPVCVILDALNLPPGVSCYTQLLQHGLELICRSGFELSGHELVLSLNNGTLQAAQAQTRGSLQAKIATADDHSVFRMPGMFYETTSVAKIPEGMDAGQIDAGNGRTPRRGTKAEDKLLVISPALIVRLYESCLPVDVDNAASFEFKAPVINETREIQDDVVFGRLAGKKMGQPHSIVGRPGLGVEQNDPTGAAEGLGDMEAGPTGANDHDFRLVIGQKVMT